MKNSNKEIKNFNQLVNEVKTDSVRKKESVNVSINQEVSKIETTDKIEKTKVFQRAKEILFPSLFDDSQLQKELANIPDEYKNIILDAKKKEFEKANRDKFKKFNNLSFEKIIQTLQTDKKLFADLLNVCCVKEFEKENYIKNNKVIIYHSNQNESKQFVEQTISETSKTGNVFTETIFAEYTEMNTENILRSIRYFNLVLDAKKRLLNKTKDETRILKNISELSQKAKEIGFSLEQITEQINKVFAK